MGIFVVPTNTLAILNENVHQCRKLCSQRMLAAISNAVLQFCSYDDFSTKHHVGKYLILELSCLKNESFVFVLFYKIVKVPAYLSTLYQWQLYSMNNRTL